MEDAFSKIVSQIFNNWTALRLAVEHSMGGPNSKQSAVEFRNYMVQFCLCEANVDVEMIQDAMEDILDQEFETVCEDDSTKQIAQILYKFLDLLRQGKTDECEQEFLSLPTVNNDWLNQQTCLAQRASNDSSSDNTDDEMETETPQGPSVDPDGWTEVKTRRKR